MFKVAAIVALCCQVGACASITDEELSAELAEGISDTSSFGTLPEMVWLQKAKQNFHEGNYGLAERFYRRSIEEQPRNVEAWLGLAASYDRLKRYDLAGKAYDTVVKLAGHTPTVLNNLAFHEMLKGNLAGARRHLDAADRADPGNPHVRTNMERLKELEVEAGRRT